MGTLTPLFSLVHDFLLVSLPDEQKCSPNTIRSYRKSLELLFDFIKTKRNISLSEITFEMIDRNAVSEFWIISKQNVIAVYPQGTTVCIASVLSINMQHKRTSL